ncbi:hypothetical protein GSI_10038 [Ganoderma sinense ZZ0214-1]|uniref:Fungal-type protein kinase domain-containing protein n=1 Tax=Ganoderma sinense ZZ0214-1 TaxID=1077348 RepID=A0A2G8RZG3_9APHY|nr:hypothetical protein GSI_10038 [Ganoderma sinense ZZ0214-1]
MTLVQGSDYARLLRAARPLITHLFGVFFCGNSFSIAHFDYSGIHISPQFFILPNDSTGLHQLIRVFLRMTMEMSPYELGCDPTCFLEPSTQTYYQAQFPSFAVTMRGPGVPGSEKPNTAGTVRTVGKPLFSSHSFLGRGTSVWLAFNEDTHEPTILKNSWRTPDRDSEITIYQKIRERIGDEQVRGLATVTGGGDVYFKGEPLSIATVRDSPALLDPTETNRVLHRVTLSQVGKPLYDYTCLEELGIALLDALHGMPMVHS